MSKLPSSPLQSRPSSSSSSLSWCLRIWTLSLIVLSLSAYWFNISRTLPEWTMLTSYADSMVEVQSRQQQQQQQELNPRICPHVLELYGHDPTMLQQVMGSVEEATRFHLYGGSFQSIQQFLNEQIDHTLSDRLGIDYVPVDDNSSKDQTTNKLTATQYLKHYYETNDVKRGGYGQPLPIKYVDRNQPNAAGGKNKNGIVSTALFSERWIDVMEDVTRKKWTESVGPDLQPKCPNLLSFGKTYEMKHFCIEPAAALSSNHTTVSSTHQEDNSVPSESSSSSCHIFSVGSNDQWGFEEELIRDPFAIQNNCHTHTFDCTLNGPPKRKPNNPNVHFYPYCVGSGKTNELPQQQQQQEEEVQKQQQQKQKRQYLPYTDLWNMTGIPSAPKILKMDIEGFEFDVVLSMLQHAPRETWPEQIQMEVHYSTRMVDIDWMPRIRQAAELAMFFDTLFNVGGYMPVTRTYFDPHCPGCFEVLLVRVKC